MGGSVSVGIAGWLIGILIASIFPKTNVYINLMPIVNAIGIFLWPSTKKKPVVFLVMLSLALFRFSYTEEKINQEIAKLPFEQNIELSGLVTVSSDAGDNGSQFVVKGTLGKDKENIKTNRSIFAAN